jgi:hypothetical protein
VKPTVDLREPPWRATEIRAMNEWMDRRTVVVAALEAYLEAKPKRREEEDGR